MNECRVASPGGGGGGNSDSDKEDAQSVGPFSKPILLLWHSLVMKISTRSKVNLRVLLMHKRLQTQKPLFLHNFVIVSYIFLAATHALHALLLGK